MNINRPWSLPGKLAMKERQMKHHAFCRLRAFALALVILFGLPANIASAQPPPPLEGWQTTKNADHPLVGKILDVVEQAEITPDQLIERLAQQRFILLGEIHDNKDHHRLQAWVISQLGSRKRTPNIVMEQIRADQAGLLKLFMSGKFKTAKRMGPAIGWEKSGWPKWEIYQPIAKAALDNKVSIFAGDTTKDMNRKVGKQGFKALAKGEAAELGLDNPLGKALDTALANELVGSHCNMMPARMMGPMALVQRYRDAHLARAMLKADKGDGSILITGNGHARTDRAVPWYLRGAQKNSVSVLIVEARKDAKTFLDLISLDPDGKATADFIWVTPGVDREDPCLKLKKQFGGKHGKSNKPGSNKKEQ